MTTIYFRVDGNSDIATGHIMRCLAIARACMQAGKELAKQIQISFLVSDDESRSLLEERFEAPEEYIIHTLNSDYRHPEEEMPNLLSYIADQAGSNIAQTEDVICRKPWLFVDSYFVSPSYFQMLFNHCKIAYLDDLRRFDCPVDLLINYDTESDCPHYSGAVHKLLGLQYTPLRTQFQSPKYQVRPKVLHVFVSTGGTDPYGVAQHLLLTIYDRKPCQQVQAIDGQCSSGLWDIARLQTLHYHVVTSKANLRYDNLAVLAANNPHIHIHENVSDMVSLMASCDLAVSAGGTTLSELCAVGVPTISYLMADNQRTAVETFATNNIIPCAGDIRCAASLSIPVTTTILQFMTNMSENMELRQKSSHKMRAFLDGCGARRIADALLSL